MQPRLLWLVLTWATFTNAARLLAVLPTNTKSHHVMYGRILQALANRNHHLTIITHFPMKRTLPNVREISLAGTIPEIQNNLNVIKHDSIKPSFIRNLEKIMEECVESCEVVAKVPAVKALFNSSETFDLIIVEVFGSDCFLPLSVKYRAPLVGLLSSVPLPWVNEQLGNPEATAYVPSYMVGYGQRMTLWERLVNTISVIIAKILYKYKSQVPSQIIADHLFGPGPRLEALSRNYSLILSNSHFSINEVRPLVPTLIEVGGLHLDASPDLPKNMKNLLDASTDGVIYWSFGSMSRIETIPSEVLSKIFNVLSELPQIVLIKMDRQRLAQNLTVPDNVYTMNWIPQHATLSHPNMKLFISHGGLLGIQEAVACGVPMLMVPLYADQALNAKGMSERGVAEIVELEETEIDNWRQPLRSLLSDPKYKQNAMNLREIFLDRPMKPLDMGIYWIEYVLRHKGATHLRSPALDLTLSQYLLLDAFALSMALSLLSAFILHKLFRYLCTMCIKWWPKVILEKHMFKKNFRLFLCILWKCKIKSN